MGYLFTFGTGHNIGSFQIVGKYPDSRQQIILCIKCNNIIGKASLIIKCVSSSLPAALNFIQLTYFNIELDDFKLKLKFKSGLYFLLL